MFEVFGVRHHIPRPHTVCGAVSGGGCRTGCVPARVGAPVFLNVVFVKLHAAVAPDHWTLAGQGRAVLLPGGDGGRSNVTDRPTIGRRAATIVTRRAETRDLGAGLGRAAYAAR